MPVNEVLKSQDRKLLILAPEYDRLLAQTKLKTYLNGEYRDKKQLNLILCQYHYNKLSPFQDDDVCAILDCVPIDFEWSRQLIDEMKQLTDGEKYDFIDENKYELIGSAKKVYLSIGNGAVFQDVELENNKKYNAQILKAQAEKTRLPERNLVLSALIKIHY